MTLKKKKYMKLSVESELIDNLNFTPVLNNRIRQVKWLYNNSNKCTMVYPEKLVRLIVQKLQEKVKELEEEQLQAIGYLFEGKYYKSLHELKGKTMNMMNQPIKLYKQ